MADSGQKLFCIGLLLILATSAYAYGDSGYESSGDSKHYSSGSSGHYSSGYSGNSGDSSSGYSGDSSSGYAGDSSSGKTPQQKYSGKKQPCNPHKETLTTEVAIKWIERPDDCPGFFKAHGIELEWLYDWEEENWSVYAAEDVETANAIMEDLNEVIKGNDLTGDGPMSDKRVCDNLRAFVKGMYGAYPASGSQAKPAALPAECSGPVPNSCPVNTYRALNTIRAPAVWNALPGAVNANPTSGVMVIDSGIRPTHTDFAGNLVPRLTVTGMNRATGQPQLPQPVPLTALPFNAAWASHGTHVSGTVFARWDNGASTAVGVVGKALGGSCECGIAPAPGDEPTRASLNSACLNNCIRYARQAGNVRVINLSYGGDLEEATSPNVPNMEREAIQAFCNSEGIVVVAAGNEGVDIIRPGARVYPAALAQDLAATNPTCIINVANLEQDGVTLSQDSNFGSFVQVAAPGEDITSVGYEDDTSPRLSSGTSMAAPHVAGMATLLFNAFPGATQTQVYNCIVNTATRPVRANPGTPGQRIAGGVVDLEAAYNCMRNNPTCPTTDLPACVDPRSGQPVQGCDTRDRFCRAIPGNDRFVCQYSFRPAGALCALSASTTTASFTETALEELSAIEIQELGLDAEPSAETFEDAGEADASVVQIAGASETQQTRRTKPNRANRGNKALPCGQCQNNVCVAASAKWCKEARRRPADAATAAAVETTASSI